jgi:hypothetical protein
LSSSSKQIHTVTPKLEECSSNVLTYLQSLYQTRMFLISNRPKDFYINITDGGRPPLPFDINKHLGSSSFLQCHLLPNNTCEIILNFTKFYCHVIGTGCAKSALCSLLFAVFFMLLEVLLNKAEFFWNAWIGILN